MSERVLAQLTEENSSGARQLQVRYLELRRRYKIKTNEYPNWK